MVSVQKGSGHIPTLDGLRAVSFLLVFLGHAGLERYVPGGFGVTIFFFLSGFLITTLMRSEYERSGWVDLRHFWLRRALRILPAFYLVLVGVTVVTLLCAPAGTLLPWAVAARALHFTNYWIINRGYAGEPPGTGIYWSLAVEEHFYLIFPWLYLGLQKMRLSGRTQAMTFWAICGLILLWRVALVVLLHASTNRTYMGSDTRMDSILFGCALAVWRNPTLDAPQWTERTWKLAMVPAAILLLVLCLVVRGEVFRETIRYSLQGVALTAMFVAAIRFPQWSVFRLLNWRPLAFLGVLSYSCYLLHYSMIFGVQSAVPSLSPVAQGAVALVASVLLAWLIYIVIERPCARLRKRLSGERSVPVAATPVAAMH